VKQFSATGHESSVPSVRRPLREPIVRPQSSTAASFDVVYREHGRTVARWVQRLGGLTLDAEDAFQEVFLTVSRRLPEFRGEAKLTTWLFRITAGVVANHRRTQRRRQFWERLARLQLKAAPPEPPTPAEQLEEREAAAIFYQVLDSLGENQRQVLVLFELEELSTDDIARLLDRPPTTIRVWLHRARAQFSHRWQQLHRQQEETK